MTVCVHSFKNEDGIIANICYDKFSVVPYLSICVPIDYPCVHEIYRNHYKDEKSAVKALKAYAKRHSLKPFEKR